MRLIKGFCVNAALILDTERVLDIEEENVIVRIRFALVLRILEYVVQLESRTPGRSNVDTNGGRGDLT